MNVLNGTITAMSAGSLPINAGFAPSLVEILVGSRASTTETSPRRSDGWATSGNQFCHSLYIGSTNRQRTYNDRIVSIWDAGTEVLRVDFTNFSGNTVNLNVVIPNSAYQLFIKVLA